MIEKTSCIINESGSGIILARSKTIDVKKMKSVEIYDSENIEIMEAMKLLKRWVKMSP